MSVPDDEAAELANDLAIANAQVKWMEAEIEQLCTLLAESGRIADGFYNELRIGMAEIEPRDNWEKVSAGALKEQFRLAARNAELTAALRPFADARIVDATMRENARRALEGK